MVAKRVPLDGGGYNVDHTASVFMMDSKGRFSGLIDYHENEEMALQKMRRLAACSRGRLVSGEILMAGRNQLRSAKGAEPPSEAGRKQPIHRFGV